MSDSSSSKYLCIALLKGLAPYFTSVPTFNKKLVADSVSTIVISLLDNAFWVSFNIKFIICNNCSLVSWLNITISSTLFKNSGLKVSLKVSNILELLIWVPPNPIEFVFRLEPALEVIIIIVFSKLIVFPWASVNLPSSKTWSNILNTSGCAFSISSNNIIE